MARDGNKQHQSFDIEIFNYWQSGSCLRKTSVANCWWTPRIDPQSAFNQHLKQQSVESQVLFIGRPLSVKR